MVCPEGHTIFRVYVMLRLLLDELLAVLDYDALVGSANLLTSGASRGWDNGNYPTSKKVVFGLNVTF